MEWTISVCHLLSVLLWSFVLLFCSAADEIVVQYVLGVLENLGCGSELDEEEEVEPFSEMMTAYLPGFSDISM